MHDGRIAILTRTAKSGAKGNTRDLLSYIQHTYRESGLPIVLSPPLPTTTTVRRRYTAHSTRYNAVAQRGVRHTLLRMPVMELAMDPNEHTAPIDFTVLLSEAVGYHSIALGRRVNRRSRLLLCAARKGMHKRMFASWMISAVFSSFVNIRNIGGVDPAPQLIAAAIAAFDSIDNNHVQALNLPPLPRSAKSYLPSS